MPAVGWKAVGASLEDLAQTVRKASKRTPGVFAYANSGVIQQAGAVTLDRYVVKGQHAESKSGYKSYTAPPGATHGPITRTNRMDDGRMMRDARGHFLPATRTVENKLFVKGKFVSRSGELEEALREIAGKAPAEALDRIICEGESGQRQKHARIIAGITPEGNGYIELQDGYRAAEVGRMGTVSNGVRGVWRGLRSVQARWATLVRKKFPDLLDIKPAIGGR